MSVVYSIRNWKERFEVAQSRKVDGPLSWVAVPTKHDGLGFRRIMALPDGAAIYGAWVLTLGVAAKCDQRGVLADENGPLDASDLAIKTGCQQSVFEKMLNALSDNKIGWVLVSKWEQDRTTLPTQDSTGQDSTGQNKGDGDESPPVKVRPEDVPIPEALQSDVFLAARTAWFAMRRRKRRSLRAEYITGQYTRLLPLGPTQAAACLMYSADNDYDGVFPERFTNGRNATGKIRPGSQPQKSGERGL